MNSSALITDTHSNGNIALNEEHRLNALFDNTDKDLAFTYHGHRCRVLVAGKPTVKRGEPKTDAYVKALADDGTIVELKISYKKENADFIENKVSAQRAQQLFGSNYRSILASALAPMRCQLAHRPLIYKRREGRIADGSITLGWRLDVINKQSGLCVKAPLTRRQTHDIYSGANLEQTKRDALVHGEVIKNSGVANCMLIGMGGIETPQDIINRLVNINEYIDEHPFVYLALKAVNYRSKQGKVDGNRPLVIPVHYGIDRSGMLTGKLGLTDTDCLEYKANDVCVTLSQAMCMLHASTTDGLTSLNCLAPICE